jgi:hypothetical protein
MEMQDERIPLFIAILSAHRGLGQAIGVAEMAGRLGFPPGKYGEREAQKIKKLAVEKHGIPIGSSCGADHGWYWIATQDEMDATIRNYRNRVKSLCVLIAKTTAAVSLSGVMRQLAMEFEVEVTHDQDLCALSEDV